MVDLMTDLNAAEAFMRKIGLDIECDVWPLFDMTGAQKRCGTITHPMLYEYYNHRAIFVTFIQHRGYKIYKLLGMNPDGTVIFDRSDSHCKVVIPGNPGWEERIVKEVEEIRYTLTRYYKEYTGKMLEQTLSVLE